MDRNIKVKTNDTSSNLLNYLNNIKTDIHKKDDSKKMPNKSIDLDKLRRNISNCEESLTINNEKDSLLNRKSGTILNKKKEENCTSISNDSKDNEKVLNIKQNNEKKLDIQENDSKNSALKESPNEKISVEQLKKNNSSDSGYIESLKCEIENKIESETIQKHKSKLNPIAPEFKPQNALYMYQKIQQLTKKNMILLIKSFAYKGIKLENISGEYCKKYNALLNLSHAGFTNIFDLLKSLDYCLIYEEIKDQETGDKKKIQKNVNDTESSGQIDEEKNVNNEKKKDIRNEEEQCIKDDQEKNIKEDQEKNIEKKIENNEEKNTEKKEENEVEKNTEKKIENNIENDLEKDIEKRMDKDIKNYTVKNVEEDKEKNNENEDVSNNKENKGEKNDDNEKYEVSEKNLIIKYKTPKMDENKTFFTKIILGTIAECTNYNEKLSDEVTPINNSISLTKLPQEVKKIFGSFFNLKALQIRCGIDKLQTFLEEIQEIQIIAFHNDIKLRVTPQTFSSKIPNLKYIKSLIGNDLKSRSPTKLNSKKHSVSMQFLDQGSNSFNTYNTENILNVPRNKKNSFDNVQKIKGINYNDLKNINFSFNKNSSLLPKLPQKNLKNFLFGENFNSLSNNDDTNLLNKLNFNSQTFKSNIYSNSLMNIYNTTKVSNNKDNSNKNFIPKILTKMQLHILLFQLIVILSERQKLEWGEINKIKNQILYSNSRTSEDKYNEKDDLQANTENNIGKNEVDINNLNETDINANEDDKKKATVLDFINTSGTTGSSEYLNESFKTCDTSNLFKTEKLSSSKQTMNYDFFNSCESENNNEQFIGVFVSSIKSEWNKTYSEQYPLSFYLNYYKTKKLRKLLEEIPNLIIAGYGRTMQVFTLDAAQEYYDNLFTDKQKNFKTFAKSKFTSLSNSQYFKDITYKDIAEAYVNGDTINLLNILGKEDLKIPKANINKIYDKLIHKSSKNGNYYHLDNYRDVNKNYKHDDFEKKNNFLFKKENLEILRYHLHKLLYNLVIHVCKKQNSLFLKYKANGVILSEYEMNKQLCGPVYYSSDLTYEDFITAKKSFFEKETIKKSVYMLSQHGIYGIKFIHLNNEWFKLYKCELRPLMKICNYQKIGQMICNMPNVFVVGEGFDTKYIPNTQLDSERKTFNDLVVGALAKTSTDDYSYNNKVNFQRITHEAANMPKNNNVAYESIMRLLFPNTASQRNTNMQTYSNSYSSFRDFNDYKKHKPVFPDIHNSYSFKNDISINHLFKNL